MIRCADLGPTPGRRPSSSMRDWSGPEKMATYPTSSAPGKARRTRASAELSTSTSSPSSDSSNAVGVLGVVGGVTAPHRHRGRRRGGTSGGSRRISAVRAPTVLRPRAGRGGSWRFLAGVGPAGGWLGPRVDHQFQADGTAELFGQCRLDLAAHLLAPAPVGLVGQAEHRPFAIDPDEPAGLEQRLGLGPEATDDMVTPRLDQLVPGRERPGRHGGRWGRWGGRGRRGGRVGRRRGGDRSGSVAGRDQVLRTTRWSGPTGGVGPVAGGRPRLGSGGCGASAQRSQCGLGTRWTDRAGLGFGLRGSSHRVRRSGSRVGPRACRRRWRLRLAGFRAGRRGRYGRSGRHGPGRSLQPLDAGEQGFRRVVGLGMGQADQGHLEVDPGIGGVTHVDLGETEHLHGPDQGGQAHPFGPGGQGGPLAPRYRHQLGEPPSTGIPGAGGPPGRRSAAGG